MPANSGPNPSRGLSTCTDGHLSRGGQQPAGTEIEHDISVRRGRLSAAFVSGGPAQTPPVRVVERVLPPVDVAHFAVNRQVVAGVVQHRDCAGARLWIWFIEAYLDRAAVAGKERHDTVGFGPVR